MDYYDHLRPYMTELFSITVKAAREDEEKVALQAVEFWCTIAEEEMEVKEVWRRGGLRKLTCLVAARSQPQHARWGVLPKEELFQ